MPLTEPLGSAESWLKNIGIGNAMSAFIRRQHFSTWNEVMAATL